MTPMKYDPHQVVVTISYKVYENRMKTEGGKDSRVDASLQIKGFCSSKKGPVMTPIYQNSGQLVISGMLMKKKAKKKKSQKKKKKKKKKPQKT